MLFFLDFFYTYILRIWLFRCPFVCLFEWNYVKSRTHTTGARFDEPVYWVVGPMLLFWYLLSYFNSSNTNANTAVNVYKQQIHTLCLRNEQWQMFMIFLASHMSTKIRNSNIFSASTLAIIIDNARFVCWPKKTKWRFNKIEGKPIEIHWKSTLLRWLCRSGQSFLFGQIRYRWFGNE